MSSEIGLKIRSANKDSANRKIRTWSHSTSDIARHKARLASSKSLTLDQIGKKMCSSSLSHSTDDQSRKSSLNKISECDNAVSTPSPSPPSKKSISCNRKYKQRLLSAACQYRSSWDEICSSAATDPYDVDETSRCGNYIEEQQLVYFSGTSFGVVPIPEIAAAATKSDMPRAAPNAGTSQNVSEAVARARAIAAKFARQQENNRLQDGSAQPSESAFASAKGVAAKFSQTQKPGQVQSINEDTIPKIHTYGGSDVHDRIKARETRWRQCSGCRRNGCPSPWRRKLWSGGGQAALCVPSTGRDAVAPSLLRPEA
mmetsp:Transcript_6961/g.14495  ORF Transcript_6961/g.14495 Transcript_6961/m.14495 type:complete len:314 (-) Transcript_6961:462-1403(-)